jgi:hypothetical protein
MSAASRILDKLFFQIYFEKKIGNSLNGLLTESEMKTTDPEKVIRVKNNESFLTPDNWEHHKETFFNQRLESYKCSYTTAEKIKLELERLKVLTTDTTDSRILKDRYRAFLLSQLEQPAAAAKPIKTLNEYFHNIQEDGKQVFFNELKAAFPTEIGKNIKVIIEELQSKRMLVIGAREFKPFIEALENEFGRNIGSYQSIQNVNDIHKDTSAPLLEKLNPLIIKYKTI